VQAIQKHIAFSDYGDEFVLVKKLAAGRFAESELRSTWDPNLAKRELANQSLVGNREASQAPSASLAISIILITW